MNLSNKQVQALVKEISPVVAKHQKEKLSKLEVELKKELKSTVKSLNAPFKIVWWLVKWLVLDNALLSEKLWIAKSSYSKESIFYSEDGIVQYAYDKLIKDRFVSKYWKEVTADDIEHEVIMATIWASNIESLIESVKAKLLK